MDNPHIIFAFLMIAASGMLNRWMIPNMRNKIKTDAKPAANIWNEDDWDWETFVLWHGHGDGICWQCRKENHSACHQPECQCKDSACTAIRISVCSKEVGKSGNAPVPTTPEPF